MLGNITEVWTTIRLRLPTILHEPDIGICVGKGYDRNLWSAVIVMYQHASDLQDGIHGASAAEQFMDMRERLHNALAS